MNLENLRTLFHDQLRDVYSAENQLLEAVPKMIAATTSPDLKQALTDHLAQTRQHAQRVQQLMSDMKISAGSKKCAAMEGIIKESGELAAMKGDNTARDAGIIAAAQKVEHYEIATYGTLRAWAKALGETSAVGVLETTLNEEHIADNTLDRIAEGYLNREAV